MNIWHDIAPDRISAKDFIAVVEISKGGKEKYELDKPTGRLILDRILYTSTHYPANYGFIPLTLAGDGDPMDVLILCSQPLIPLSMVRCYPIGVIVMSDGGARDEKIIAIPYSDPNYNCYTAIDQLPQHVFQEMQHFFSVYKQLENKATAVSEVYSEEKAVEIVQNSIDNYWKSRSAGLLGNRK